MMIWLQIGIMVLVFFLLILWEIRRLNRHRITKSLRDLKRQEDARAALKRINPR